IAIAPADGSVGETATVRVRAVDEWGNATSVEAPRLTGAVRIGTPVENDGYAVWEVPVSWTQAGVHRLEVQAGDLRTTTNPSRIHEQPQKQRLLWGDLHGGQSEIGCGAGSLDHHYAYARDVAGLQFTSQQANDHYITAALWQHVRDVTPRYNSPDFLAFLGCEWSPYTQDGGDRNVIYLTDEPALHRSDRFFEETDPDATADLRQAPEFLESFRTRDVLLNLHVGGRPTNLDFHAAEIEPLFEVHSTHATSEWFLFDAISRGYKVGVTAGTDGVMGRPGACGPGRRVTRNVRNGLTAVVAESLNQRHVADAFLERRCYGTSGARILLDVQVSGAPMGAEITSGGPIRICAQVEGTAPIERVDFFRGVECIHSQTLTTPDPNRLRLLWGGARERGTARAQRQSWDGTLQVSGARIDDVRPVGMQSPDDRIISHEQGFRFDAVTAGNDMGCTFTVDRTVDQTGDQTGDQTVETAARPTEDPTFHIVTDIASFEASLSQIQAETLTVAAGGLERRLELGPAPLADTSHTGTDASCSGQAEFEDTNPGAGEHAYWVRIIQTDRHRAWSSPVYVTVSGS
ncbi:MAG: hypothetical protein HOB49_22375, partial [Gemmatimonadetes bacterium]|nr:hypothetical protein [Gemmatimonadota bacterium]